MEQVSKIGESAEGRLILKPVSPSRFAWRTLHWTRDRQAMADLNLGSRQIGFLRWWRWLRKESRSNRACSGIWLKDDGRLAGMCITSFHPAANDVSAYVCIGDAEFRTSEFADETMAAVLADLFDRRRVNKVTSWINAANTAAVERALASGFTREVVLRQSAFDAAGNRTDQLAFGMLRSEWLERHERDPDNGPQAGSGA